MKFAILTKALWPKRLVYTSAVSPKLQKTGKSGTP